MRRLQVERRLPRASPASRLALSGWSLVTLLAVAGCAGLPVKPQASVLPKSVPLTDVEAGGQWPAQDWWIRYHDETLNQLIDVALASSPTLATARSRFASARQSVRIAGAVSGAHVTAISDADRQRLSDNGVFPPRLLGFSSYNVYDLGLQASYTFDWWGKQKNAVDSALDEAHASQADRSAAALVLTSAVAETYFGWQADESRLQLAHERENTVLQQGGISASRIRADLESADALQRSESSMASAREQSASLQGSARLRLVALAALLGRSPAELPELSAKPLPSVAAALPNNVSLDLMARRADITASRWRVEAAERTRESARDDFYPDISVNALLGVQSIDLGSLLKYGSRVPQVSGALHLPIFDAGRLRARYGSTQAAVDSAVSSYQETLVNAAQEVATQAAKRVQIAAQRTQRALAVSAAEGLQLSAAARVRQGVTDSRAYLDATESLIEQRDALMQLDAQALSTDIGLTRALGGGYDRTQATP